MLRHSLAIAATAIGLSAIAVPASATTVTFDFTSGDDGGFFGGGFDGSPDLWIYTGTQWQTTGEVDDFGAGLVSPEFTMEADGDVTLSFDHFYDFEGPTNFIDGGGLSVFGDFGDGPDFIDIIPDGGYPASPVDGCDVFGGVECWSGNSGGFVTDTATITGLSVGDTFQLLFIADFAEPPSSDPSWAISSVSVDLPDAAAESVPEPGTIVALAMVGGSFLLRKGTKRG